MNTATLTAPPPAASAAPDLAALKTRQQAAWSSGDYAVVGTTLQIVGEHLCEALDLRSGQKVLDVAAGNGNVTLAAARRWCDVTSTDYVPGAARARPRARGGRRLAHRVQGGRRRSAAVRRRLVRRGGLDLRRDVHARPGQAPRPSCCASASPAARSASPTGRRRASSARCSRRSASTCRRRPASSRRRSGAPARASPRCSAPRAASVDLRKRDFIFRYRSAEHLAGRLQDLLRPGAEDVRGACRREARTHSPAIS